MSDKLYQSKRLVPLHHEYERWNYLKAAKDLDDAPDPAGDGDKFSVGFRRRQGDPSASLRAAATLRLETRLADHDAVRNVHLKDTINVRRPKTFGHSFFAALLFGSCCLLC
jgi:hypothetical protein